MKDTNCAICYPVPMGMSPEGWMNYQKWHDSGHPKTNRMTTSQKNECCTQLLNELIAEVEGEKQTDEWVKEGENTLMRKQHQVGYNKGVDRIKSLLENKRDSV